MKKEDLFSAIGQADEKYIKHADSVFTGDKNENKSRIMTAVKAVASVAAAVLIIGSVWFISMRYAVKDPVDAASPGTEITDEIRTVDEDEYKAIKTALDEFMSSNNARETIGDEGCTNSFWDVPSGMYGDYYVCNCITRGKGDDLKYFAVIDKADMAFTDNERVDNINGISVQYGSSQEIKVLAGGKLYYNLRDAAEAGILTDEDVYMINNHLLGFKPSQPDTTQPDVDKTRLFADIEFDENGMMTNNLLIKSALKCIERYPAENGVSYSFSFSTYKCAVILDRFTSQVTAAGKQTVAGYPFVFSSAGTEFVVITKEAIYLGLENAYNRGALNDDEINALFTDYSGVKNYLYDNSLLERAFSEYLNGWEIMDSRRAAQIGIPTKITDYNYVSIDFCMRLSDKKYAALFSIVNQPVLDFETMTSTINGYDFVYKNGSVLRVFCFGELKEAAYANLSADDTKRLYYAYNDHMGFYAPDMEAVPMLAAIRDYFKQGDTGDYGDYTVDFAFETNGIYIALISRTGTSFTDNIWQDTVAGYVFTHGNGQDFTVISGDRTYYGLHDAYEFGMLDISDIEALHARLYGSSTVDPTK